VGGISETTSGNSHRIKHPSFQFTIDDLQLIIGGFGAKEGTDSATGGLKAIFNSSFLDLQPEKLYNDNIIFLGQKQKSAQLF
jgi:hypothetical protein